jgi:heme/copper-type cytochrome/quinol oxidase subunit 4
MLVRNNGYGDLGVFEAADQWKIVIQFIPTAVCQITLPILSSINDNSKFRRTLMGILLLIGGISTFLALATLTAAPLLMPLYGSAFTNNAPLAILALSTIPTAIALVMEMMMYSREKMWTCLLFNIIWGIVAILFSHYYLMKGKGAESLALAILMAYLSKMALMGIYFILIQKRTSK